MRSPSKKQVKLTIADRKINDADSLPTVAIVPQRTMKQNDFYDPDKIMSDAKPSFTRLDKLPMIKESSRK